MRGIIGLFMSISSIMLSKRVWKMQKKDFMGNMDREQMIWFGAEASGSRVTWSQKVPPLAIRITDIQSKTANFLSLRSSLIYRKNGYDSTQSASEPAALAPKT
jgi:hypothetical protein